jgi:hypothetical protein
MWRLYDFDDLSDVLQIWHSIDLSPKVGSLVDDFFDELTRIGATTFGCSFDSSSWIIFIDSWVLGVGAAVDSWSLKDWKANFVKRNGQASKNWFGVQGDQIGQIFAYWAIAFSWQFLKKYSSSPHF